MSKNLEEKVNQFKSLGIPGQPTGMHMGTYYLISDLWEEVKRLRCLHYKASEQAVEDGTAKDWRCKNCGAFSLPAQYYCGGCGKPRSA